MGFTCTASHTAYLGASCKKYIVYLLRNFLKQWCKPLLIYWLLYLAFLQSQHHLEHWDSAVSLRCSLASLDSSCWSAQRFANGGGRYHCLLPLRLLSSHMKCIVHLEDDVHLVAYLQDDFLNNPSAKSLVLFSMPTSVTVTNASATPTLPASNLKSTPFLARVHAVPIFLPHSSLSPQTQIRLWAVAMTACMCTPSLIKISSPYKWNCYFPLGLLRLSGHRRILCPIIAQTTFSQLPNRVLVPFWRYRGQSSLLVCLRTSFGL